MRPFHRLRNFLWIFLLPLSWLWATVTRMRRRFYPKSCSYRSALKIICIGNLHSGGSGKTPLVLQCVQRLQAFNPAVVSRGYRGKLSSQGAKVNLSETQGTELYGDEPWMLAQRLKCDVYVGKNRARLVRQIEKKKSNQLIILDDGFQHLKLQRDLDVVAIPADRPPADSACLPLGELREPLTAIKSASAVILTGNETTLALTSWRNFLLQNFSKTPVFTACRINQGLWDGETNIPKDSAQSWVGFCGLASPEGFAQSLKEFEAPLIASFPDHHAYTLRDAKELIKQRKTHGAEAFITTEKDILKIKPLLSSMGERVVALRIGYEISEDFWYFLKKRLE